MATLNTSATTTIGMACTNYLQIDITVPASGTVMVQAQVWVTIDHTVGTRDLAHVKLSTSPASCGIGPYNWPVDIPTDAPTATAFYGAFPQTPFPVTAGTNTFYLNGIMFLGQSAGDAFFYANVVAVFYPT